MTWLFPWWVASLVSNLAIIATEYINRSARGSWLEVLPQTVPLIVLAQYCLFVNFNGAPHWMTAWAVFAVGNSIMRVAAVQTLAPGEISSWPHALSGILVMIVGAFLVKSGLK